MRLLQLQDNGEFGLVEFYESDIPPYIILSHTWGTDQEEVTFKDIMEGTGKHKAGFAKIEFCGKQAVNSGIQYFWVDTCCIDKSSSAELSEAINSMFEWYQKAKTCLVYLADVSVGTDQRDKQEQWISEFQRSRWFTRGWTLQELLAPTSVQFFSAEGTRLGDNMSLLQEIHQVTNIPIQALQGYHLSHFSIDERISWAETRSTKRGEDAAYSLLGIFDTNMPLIYGEGKKKAFLRLRKEIYETLVLELEGHFDQPRVFGTGISSAPSAIVYDGKMYCFHQGGGYNGELWYNVFDGTKWLGDTRVHSVGMSSGPSATVYDNKIYCLHQGGGNNGELWYNVFDGSGWIGDTKVAGVGMSSGPSAVVYNNSIYCFHQGLGICGELWYTVFDGSTWSKDTRVPGVGISSGPSAIVHDNKIYCFHQGGRNNGELWYNVFDGTDWSGDTIIHNVGTSSRPSAIVYNDKIYCFHHGGRHNGELWCYLFDDADQVGDVRVSGGISSGPSAIVYDDKIYCFRQGYGGSSELWYNVYDRGVWKYR